MLAASALCRSLHDGALMLVFGAALFAAFGVPAALRPAASARAARLAAGALPLAAVTLLARMPLAAAAMGGGWPAAHDPAVLWAVLSDTAFGHAWALHGVAVALACLWWRGPPARLAGAAALALASLALGGHTAARDGAAGWLDRATLALHLLAAGAWIGSLPEVLALMHRLSGAPTAREAARALRRFSAAGHAAVALVIGTGAADAVAVAGDPRGLVGTAYGAALAGKGALAAGMATLALVNRYRLVPRLGRDPLEAARAMRRNTRAVLLLGFGAVATAGLLGLLDPP